jgi:hypothetical protein
MTHIAWHSLKGSVHHDNDHCETALLMQSRNFKTGTGEKPLCRHCESLNSKGFPRVMPGWDRDPRTGEITSVLISN